MKKSALSFLFLFLLIAHLFSDEVLVRVGKSFITKSQLNEYMRAKFLTDEVKGLDGLIRQQLLLDYAKEKEIEVANQEIIQYYQDELKQSLTLDDINRLRSQKSKELESIRVHLMTMKAREFIKENLEVDKKKILQNFLFENSRIDISYFIADRDLFDLPEHFTFLDLQNFAGEKYGFFDKLEKIKFKYTLVFENEETMNYDLSFLFPENQFDLFDYKKKTARQLAEDLRNAWEDDIPPDRIIFETGYLRKDQKIAHFDKIDLEPIFNSKQKCFLYEIPNGFLLIKKDGKEYVNFLSEEGDCAKVIREYISWVNLESKEETNPYKAYFKDSLFSLTAKRVGVKVEFFNPASLNYLQKLDLEAENLSAEVQAKVQTDSVIYLFLDRYITNEEDLAVTLRERINRGTLFGSFEFGERICRYKVLTYEPTFLPDFEQAKNYLYSNLQVDKLKQKKYDLKKYYDKYYSKFQRPMQLAISGVFVRISDFDTVQITDAEIENYYLKNKAKFSTAGKQSFEYIYLHDKLKTKRELADYLAEFLNEGNFSYVKDCFGSEFPSLKDKFLNYSNIDEIFKKRLNSLNSGEIDKPFYYKTGWFILKKGQILIDNYLSLEEAKEIIKTKLKMAKQDELAKEKINELDSKLQWYGNLKSYTDSPFYFKTDFQPITEPFESVGNLLPYEGDFVKMYAHKKYNKIFSTDDGYAVFFLDKLYKSSVLPFEEVKSGIVEQIENEKKEENAEQFLKVFVENLNQGDFSSREFLTYLGDLRTIQNFSPDNKLPWTTDEENLQIFRLAMQNELGFFKPAIYLSCGKYLVYRVDLKEIISKKEYSEKVDDYLADELDKMCDVWLDKYCQQVMIKYY